MTEGGAAPAHHGPFEWFTRARALAEARAALPPEDRRRGVARAASALEVADLALEPPESFRYGDPNEAIALLLAEALRAALCARQGLAEGTSLEAALDAAPRDALEAHVPEGTSLDAIVASLGRDRAALATVGRADADQRIDEARAFVRGVLTEVDAPFEAVRTLASQRTKRTATAALALVLALVGGALFAKRAAEGPELADGKPFLASSFIEAFPTEGTTNVLGAYGVFFHTREEDHPWVRIDLGAVERVGKVTIRNRVDCCGERDIPLVVELSADGEAWTEVARRDAAFDEWTASFVQAKARYVRLSVPRRTYMHLTRVSVWR